MSIALPHYAPHAPDMPYKRMGNTGLFVSRLCLGMMSFGSKEWRDWVLPYEEAKPIVKAALDAGINFFDTADMYSNGESERMLGRALKELNVNREEVVIATKCFFGTQFGTWTANRAGLSRKAIIAACDASLERLGTDYIDLYQIHRHDENTPISEVVSTLHDLVRSGKVRYIGASSMPTWIFSKYLHEAQKRGMEQFVCMQPHYNLAYREEEREMLPLCKDAGIGVIPWSPLARGFLCGNRTRDSSKTTRGASDDKSQRIWNKEYDFAVQDRVLEVAAECEKPPAQVAVAWLLSKDVVTAPIIGVTSVKHLLDAVAATQVKLTPEQIQRLEEPYEPHNVSN